MKKIYRSAFSNCSSLEKVELPDSVMLIDSNVFSDCESLTEIVFGENIEIIGSNALQDTALETVTFNSTKDWTVYHSGQLITVLAEDLNNNATAIEYFTELYNTGVWLADKD